MTDDLSKPINLRWVRSRCTDDGGCWLWNHGCNPSGQPSYSFRRKNGTRPTVQMRRMVWELVNGKIPDGMLVTVSCESGKCLNPDHLQLATRSDVIRRVWANAGVRAKKLAALTEFGRTRAKLDMEKARYIRASDKTQQALADELGVSIALISKVRRGQAWREQASPFAGLFTGLVASNDSGRKAA